MVRTLLVFPPTWTLLEAPPPGLTLLATFLEQQGQPVGVRDLNIEMLHHFAQRAGQQQLGEFCRTRLQQLDPARSNLTQQLLQLRLIWGLALLDDLARAEVAPTELLRMSDALARPEELFLARRRIGRLQALLNYLLQLEIRVRPELADLGSQLRGAAAAPSDPVARWLRTRMVELLRLEQPQLVGFTVNAPEQLVAALELATAVRAHDPGVLLVLGGALITKERRLLARTAELFRQIDALVVYEGETALLELVRALERHGDRSDHGMWSTIPNLLFQERGQLQHTRLRQEQLEQLPIPDHRETPWDLYLAPSRCVYLDATRGCHHSRCRYCADRFTQLGHRRRTPATIAQAMRQLALQHHVQALFFTDEALPPDLLAQLCDQLEPGPPPLVWSGELRPAPEYCTALLRRLVRAGCRRLQVGIESLSERLLREVDRGVTARDALDFLKRTAQLELPVEAFLVDGLPGETDAEREHTLGQLRSLVLPAGSWIAYSAFYLDRRSTMAHQPTRFGLEVQDPEPTALGQEPVFRCGPASPLQHGTRVLPDPIVARPGVEPPWPVEGHLALLWAAHQATPNGHSWSPQLIRLPEATGLRGRSTDLHLAPPMPPQAVLKLGVEFRLVSTRLDPPAVLAARLATEEQIRTALFAGADRAEAYRHAIATTLYADARTDERSPDWYLLDLQADGWYPLDRSHGLILALLDGVRTVEQVAELLIPHSPDPPDQVHRLTQQILGGFKQSEVVVELQGEIEGAAMSSDFRSSSVNRIAAPR